MSPETPCTSLGKGSRPTTPLSHLIKAGTNPLHLLGQGQGDYWEQGNKVRTCHVVWSHQQLPKVTLIKPAIYPVMVGYHYSEGAIGSGILARETLLGDHALGNTDAKNVVSEYCILNI